MSKSDPHPVTEATVRQPHAPPQRKAVLFCPECGHENPVDGDWIAATPSTAEQPQLSCPQCTTVILPHVSINDRDTPNIADTPHDADKQSTADCDRLGVLSTVIGMIWLHASLAGMRQWADWLKSSG